MTPADKDDIFNGRGAPLSHYQAGDADWPVIWRLPDIDLDEADLFDRLIYFADDHLLRQAVNLWDNCLRGPGTFAPILMALISVHARLWAGSDAGVEDLERAGDAVRQAWLGMAKQALDIHRRGSWDTANDEEPQ
jgi:hypothetical protein